MQLKELVRGAPCIKTTEHWMQFLQKMYMENHDTSHSQAERLLQARFSRMIMSGYHIIINIPVQSAHMVIFYIKFSKVPCTIRIYDAWTRMRRTLGRLDRVEAKTTMYGDM